MDKNTVIILGAGASVDYGYPSGSRLTEDIGNSTNFETFRNLFLADGSNPKNDAVLWQLNILEEHFFKSKSLSIDRWIAKNENIKCLEAAKLLISFYISNCEREDFSPNGFFKKTNKDNNTDDWYQLLFNALESDNFNDFPKSGDNLTIITFNYDRSLEFYLHNKLMHTYINKDKAEYHEKVKKVRILHVYGIAGEYNPTDNERHVPYGKYKNLQDLYFRADSLKLIPEHRENNSLADELNNYLKKAQRIYFLGFSYDESNLKILGFPIKSNQRLKVLIHGTTYGMLKGEIEIAKNRVKILTSTQGAVHLKESMMDAYTFFRSEVIQSFEL